jgi:hypothetical protein
VSRGFAHARGFGSHAKHPHRIISYVNLLKSATKARETAGAVRAIIPVRGIRMRELAFNFSVHFSVRRGAPYCTNDCQYRNATRRKQKLKLRMIRSVKFYACGLIPRANPCGVDRLKHAGLAFCITLKTLISKRVTESPLIFLRDSHILSKLLKT